MSGKILLLIKLMITPKTLSCESYLVRSIALKRRTTISDEPDQFCFKFIFIQNLVLLECLTIYVFHFYLIFCNVSRKYHFLDNKPILASHGNIDTQRKWDPALIKPMGKC